MARLGSAPGAGWGRGRHSAGTAGAASRGPVPGGPGRASLGGREAAGAAARRGTGAAAVGAGREVAAVSGLTRYCLAAAAANLFGNGAVCVPQEVRMSKPLTPSTYVRCISYGLMRQLADFIDPQEGWKKLAVDITNPSGDSRYNQMHIRSDIEVLERDHVY